MSSAVVATTAALVAATVVGTLHTEEEIRITSMCEAPALAKFKEGPKLVFLGTGSSTGCPIGVCTLTLNQTLQQLKGSPSTSTSSSTAKLATPQCHVSHLAAQGEPKFNKNYRNNPSFLIHHYHPDTDSYKNIIIDVGKTFREGAMRWFPEFDIQSLDSIILTHEHMDAAAGLDDIRGFQRYEALPKNHPVGVAVPPPRRIPVPIHLSRHCHDKLQGQFPFLFPKKLADKACSCGDPPIEEIPSPAAPSKPVVVRDVAGFVVNIFESYKPVRVEGLDIIPLPVWHGDDLISYGFAFSVSTSTPGKSINVVYLSDISRMVPETMEFIQEKLPPTDILVVDSLLWRRKHPTHYSLEQAVELRNLLRPRIQTYLVGMSCDSYLPHDEMQAFLNTTYGDVTMAHDGLAIALDEL